MLSLIKVPYKLLIVHLVGRYNEFAMFILWDRGRGKPDFLLFQKVWGGYFVSLFLIH